MYCNQLTLLRRLLVEDPAVLQTAPWKQHLDGCAECQRERYLLQRSLGVFRQFEAQLPPGGLSVPSWERFSRTLEHQRRWGLTSLRVRVPLAAASLLVAVSAGLLLWPVARTPEVPSPDALVTMQPESAQPPDSRMAGSDVADSGWNSLPSPATVPVRFSTDAQQRPGSGPQVTLVEDTFPLGSAAMEGGQGMGFGNAAPPDAPMMMVRSLQERRSRHDPIQVLPVFAPVHRDSGSLLPRALISPLPIR